MNANNLLRLAKISSYLEKEGFTKEADVISDSVVRLAFIFSPFVNPSFIERVWPFGLVEPTFDETDEERQKFPRYKEFDSLIVDGGDWDDETEQSLESSLHPEESNPEAGIVFVFPDPASSTEQGTGWGKSMEEHDKNNAAGERYKNLTPKFY